MKLTIVPVQGEEAISLKEFIRPEVWEMPEWKSFWYLAAKNEHNEVVGAAAVDPVEPEARLLSIAVSPACTRMGVGTELPDGGDISQEGEEQPRQETLAGVAQDRRAYWNDLHLEPVDDSDLYCARCRFRSKEDMTSCDKYLVKPGKVLYGAPCAQFAQV